MITEQSNVSDYTMLWAYVHVMIDGIVGLVLGVSVIMLFINRERWGIELGSMGLLVSLVAVNLVQFYINQFSTIIIAAYQYIVLQSLYFYDRKYVRKQRKHMPSSL